MRNNLGFSLVEVMVTIGLLSGVGLFVMKQQESSTKVQVKMSLDQEISGVTNQISKLLSRSDNCTVNLMGSSLGASLNAVDTALYLPNGTFTRGGNPIFKKGIILGSRRLQISKIEYKTLQGIKSTGPYSIGEVIAVQLEYGKSVDPTKPTKNLAQTVTKNFFVQTEKDASGRVTKCISENDNLSIEALRNACSALSATFDPVTNKCTFEAILPSCILTSEACTSYFPRQEDFNIAIQIAGRGSCYTYYDHRVDPCFLYRAQFDNWTWPGNCDCIPNLGEQSCLCDAGVSHQCFLSNLTCDPIDEIKNQTFHYCCR